MNMRKAVFLDKDGTLINDVPFNVDPERITLSCKAAEGLRLLSQLGYSLVVVSNQPGVAMGYFEESDLNRVWQRLDDLLQPEGVQLVDYYYCPHHPVGAIKNLAMDCDCRKPLPGMLLQAAEDHGIDLASSWMIGDILHDIEAGRRAGCKTVLIDNGNETEWEVSPMRMPDLTAADLHDAAIQIATSQQQWFNRAGAIRETRVV
ncbi:MAG TPA: HAD family hydrolase [Methylophilaceae bacterium]|nr:HAD family hydrolase [Methylophilaceae bacterium]